MTPKLKIHLANTFFENDLEHSGLDYKELLNSHPNFLQLQYLPLLYAKKEELVAVLDSQFQKNDRLIDINLLETSKVPAIECWGFSRSILKLFPNLITSQKVDAIQQLSSKLWAFDYVKKYLKNTFLLQSEVELKRFFDHPFFPCVIKAPDGFSARGHQLFFKKEDFHFDAFSNLKIELKKTPLIVEPWLNRFLDFSTQWIFTDENFECLGTTLLYNNLRGGYLGNSFNPQDRFMLQTIPEIAYHFEAAKPLLDKIHLMGFRGNLGIDAFFYIEDDRLKLMPIIEINPRKTMGLVTIKFTENNRFESPVFLRLVDRRRCQLPLLPTEIIVNNQKILFKKNLEIQTDPGEYTNANHENPRWQSFKWNH
jgi:hypothetical protein